MEKLQEWCTCNDMVINTMKSKSMIMGSCSQIRHLESDFNKLQRRAPRIILNAKYDIPSLQLFKKLGWLSIKNRFESHNGVIMYKCIDNSAPYLFM